MARTQKQGTSEFKALLSAYIRPWLRDRGFTPIGHRFVRWIGPNCQVISFRRAKWSVAEGYEFLVDLGVLSRRIWNFFVRLNESGRVEPHWKYPVTPVVPRLPFAEDCHWRTSIQGPILVPEYFNKTWSIRDMSEVPQLADEIEGVLANHALPALDRYATDEALRDLWLQTPKFAGVGLIQHLTYLAVLLAELGPGSELPIALDKLRLEAQDGPAIGLVIAQLESDAARSESREDL